MSVEQSTTGHASDDPEASILRTDGLRHALVVMDMQTIFISPDGPFANHDAGAVVDGVNELAARCRARRIPVLFSRYTLRDDLRDAGLLSELPFVQDGHLCSSSPMSRIDERIVVEPDDIVLEHNRPSGFFDSDLAAVLRGFQVEAIILAGVSINNAIGATARDAFARDLPVLVPRQAVAAAPGEEHLETYLDILDRWTADVIDISDIPG